VELSVVIVNWNTRDLLAQCLDSLYDSLILKDYEVFVVDNASDDGSPAMVNERFSQVQLIGNTENVGFARANNQAIRLSTGSYILLLNSDTIVKPGAIDALVDFMNAHLQAGACGARLLNQDGSLQFSCSPVPTLGSEFKRLFHLPGMRPDGYYPMDLWDQSIPHRVDVILGACLLLRRKALDQVGLMDEEYFIYSEEVDLCHRLAIAGWELYWVPQGEVIHLGGQSTRQVSEAMFLRLYQAKLIYFRKQHGRRQTLVYKLIIMAAALIRVMMMPLAWLEPPLKRQALLALAGNYKRLLLALPGL
jgi:GT2 family glycosyltransferase